MAKKETKNTKNKKSFFKDFKAELKKVIWPTPKQLINNTVAVITIVLVTAAIVFALDLTFESMNKYGVEKIKEVISTNETSEENTTTNETNDSEGTENNTESQNTENATNTENVENNTANNAE